MNKEIIAGISLIALIALAVYTLVGTATRVDKIKERAPSEISERGWKILRYEGYQWGSWDKHGGKVWYHVQDIANPSINYRVYITLWGDELQYYYKNPEALSRVDIEHKAK